MLCDKSKRRKWSKIARYKSIYINCNICSKAFVVKAESFTTVVVIHLNNLLYEEKYRWLPPPPPCLLQKECFLPKKFIRRITSCHVLAELIAAVIYSTTSQWHYFLWRSSILPCIIWLNTVYLCTLAIYGYFYRNLSR